MTKKFVAVLEILENDPYINDLDGLKEDIENMFYTGRKVSIKSMPDKLETHLFGEEQTVSNMQKEDAPVYTAGYQNGWNACLNKILEEEEE